MNRHPITEASFAIIDREIGTHPWPAAEYAIVQRAIHATADFELRDLFYFSEEVIDIATSALNAKIPVVVDVSMVAVAVATRLANAQIPLHCGIDRAPTTDTYVDSQITRTAAGMKTQALHLPQAIFVVGNAPSALICLVELMQQDRIQPTAIIGVPVGFVGVEEAKARLSQTHVPQIQVRGRKGGSPVAAAIVNALVEMSQSKKTDL